MDDKNDLWVFFADDHSSHIRGPFLYCFESKTMKFKKDVRLYSDKGTPSTSPFDPLFASHDQLLLIGAIEPFCDRRMARDLFKTLP